MNSLDNVVEKTVGWFQRLSAGEVSWLCVLLFANALAQPYLGIRHDAQLYAVQVAERNHPGAFAQDLFLRFGSQDRFSLFTPLVAPLAACAGLQLAFFLVYLASKAAFFLGALRLIRALLPDRRAAVLATLLIGIVPLPFGGNAIFHINESFLTPRIGASALVLLALERMLRARLAQTLLLLAGALALHPLMAGPGILIFLLWWSVTRLPRRMFVGGLLACAVLAGTVILCQPLGNRFLGSIDDEWKGIYLNVCYFIDPSRWDTDDWIRLAWAFLMVTVAAVTFARSSSTFLGVVLAAALMGLAGTVIAIQTHYLLLLQTSPYRAMWLLEFLAVPMTVQGAFVLVGQGHRRRALGLVLLLLATCDWHYDTFPVPIVFLPLLVICAVGFRGLSTSPHRNDWLAAGAALGLVLSGLAMCAFNLVMFAFLLSISSTWDQDTNPVTILQCLSNFCYKLPLLLAVLGATAALGAWLGSRRLFQTACVVLGLGYQALIAGASQSSWYQANFIPSYLPKQSVTMMLRAQSASTSRPLTVYWPMAGLPWIWFETGCQSYFVVPQLSGCGFNRGTAIEGKRRALTIRRFELEMLSHHPGLPSCWLTMFHQLYEGDQTEPAPTTDDLFRLCREESLDYVVLDIAFEGIPSERRGPLNLYDCRVVRAVAEGRAP